MAIANIFGFPNSQAHSPRNAFDVSYDTLFNSPVGMLLPCYCQEVKSGDKLKLSVKNFTRTKAVNTAAFMSFDEKVDFFFVPYRLLWSAYNQWRLGTVQPRSSTDLMSVQRLEFHPFALRNNFIITNSSNVPVFVTDSFYGEYRFGVSYFSSLIRFLDLLGYGLPAVEDVTSVRNSSHLTESQKSTLVSFFNHRTVFNYFRIAAYQCIYQYAYRNEDFEPLDPSTFNCDSLFINTQTPSGNRILPPPQSSTSVYSTNQSTPYSLHHGFSDDDTIAARNLNRLTLKKLFEPRYKNYRRDLFSTLKPENGIDIGVSDTYNYDSTEIGGISRLSQVEGGINDSPLDSQMLQFGSYSVSASDIRRLFALDKFVRLGIYANKDYSSLYKSIFGVSVDEPNVPRYLGTFSSDVKISEIVSTAAGSDNTSNPKTSVLGELAGKGVGTGSSFVFDSSFKEDGIVMGIHYLMPFNYYSSYRIDPFTQKSVKEDYYYPSFDGLGLTPVLSQEYSYADTTNPTYDYLQSVLGFNTRYHEYKQRTNEVHGTFNPKQSDAYWTCVLNDRFVANSKYLFKINPTMTDSIFGVNWDGTCSTDPFYCFFSFNATKVSNMEAIGVPNV